MGIIFFSRQNRKKFPNFPSQSLFLLLVRAIEPRVERENHSLLHLLPFAVQIFASPSNFRVSALQEVPGIFQSKTI
jgi:hypothetical protein